MKEKGKNIQKKFEENRDLEQDFFFFKFSLKGNYGNVNVEK